MASSCELLSTHSPALFDAAVVRASALLRAGEVVALPTETVYGLAANALDPVAVARIYTAKGRPRHNPLIVHVASAAMARACVAEWSATAEALAQAFWPGPLTLVLQRSGEIPDLVTAGGTTVGIRWPAHPFMQAVIRACGFPLAAPSANRANEISPTTAEHVVASLGTRIPLVVDGGASHVGIESTVVDLTGTSPRVLRPGMIHEQSLTAALPPVTSAVVRTGKVAADLAAPFESEELSGGPLRSPGQLRRHYAPRARLLVTRWEDEADLVQQLQRAGAGNDLGRVHVMAHSRIPLGLGAARVCVIPHDAEAYARALYAEWHRCDALGAGWIVMEALPDAPEWRGLADRVARAGAVAEAPSEGSSGVEPGPDGPIPIDRVS